jgi:hypothetical protein
VDSESLIMKTFLKRSAITFGILCFAALCMGIVFIDSVNHYWRVGGDSGQYVQLIVSNRFIPISVNTNTGRIGINVTNQNTFSIDIAGLPANTNLTGNGATASTTGRIRATAGAGGASFLTTEASGGGGGAIQLISGAGGNVPFATTNATGGTGGSFILNGGSGGSGSLATNSITGGPGGSMVLQGGSGGTSSFATTQAVSGAGGEFQMFAGSSTSPGGGWSRKTGNGGGVTITAGSSGNSTRTNSGNGGAITLTGGNSGSVLTSPGDPGTPGYVELVGGTGGTGDTNANGAPVYITGGGGAVNGPVVLGVTSGGTVRGSVGVGTNSPQAKLHVAGDIALTAAAAPAYQAATPTNSVRTTNWLGLVESAAAAVLEAAFNHFSELVVTNRISAATTITLTNSSPGYAQMKITLLGEASGGSARTVTLVAHTGQLIGNLDIFGTALATSYAFTLTNGNAVEISDELRQLNGTYVHKIVTRQFAF